MPSKHLSIVEALEEHTLKEPDKPAFIFVNKTLDRLVITRQQLWDYCRKFAGVLKRKELGKGSVVCNTLRNSPQRLITELGAITAGAISMNGQICFADGSDFVFSLNQGKANAVILDPEDTKGAFGILKSRFKSYDPASGEVSCPDVPNLKYILSYPLRSEKRSFLEDLDKEEDMVHEKLKPDDVCQYLCTSGTTSMFKLVAFSSHVIMEFGLEFATAMDARLEDIYMNNRLLGWLGGYPAIYLVAGICRVIMDESNGRPLNYYECQWKMACQEKCDICYTTPASLIEFNAVRKDSNDEHVRNFRMRTIMTGSGPVTKNHMLAALKNLSKDVVVVYATTEAGVISFNHIEEFEDFEEYNTGYALLGLCIKIIDEKGGNVKLGQPGEILIDSRTSQLALYYVNDPESTSHIFQTKDGWLRLGDVGFFNNLDQLFVVGRNKFAIMRGTLVIYPYVIEEFIRNCPGVKDVVVTGVPDEKLNEEICAMIVIKPGEQLSVEDVKTFCENGLANKETVSAVPEYVLFVKEFPLGMTGKLDRNQVKKQAIGMLHIIRTLTTRST